MNFQKILRALCPPAIWKLGNRLRNGAGNRTASDAITFVGDYKSWKEAEQASSGYTAPEILAKTCSALSKVRDGRAAFERDSITSDVMEFDFPLLAGLLRAATAEGSRLSVLDFGGALGNSYFQCRKFVSIVKNLRWSVVEQPAHVACGIAEFANEELRFYDTVEECVRIEHPNAVFLSAVLQYLEKPYDFLIDILGRKIPYIIVHRVPFLHGDRNRLTVQHVPDWIYKASYPAWFLSEAQFRQCFQPSYKLICDYPAADAINPEGEEAFFKGFQFELKSNHS